MAQSKLVAHKGALKMFSSDRVAINIAPEVRVDFVQLLVHEPELQGVGYSAFLSEAIEAWKRGEWNCRGR